MPVETHVDAALDHVRAERDAVAEERAALGRFRDRVADVEPEQAVATSTAPGSGPVAIGDGRARSGTPAEDRCRAVLAAFAETVRPHCVDEAEGESLLRTVGDEFTDSIAAALAPSSPAAFDEDCKRALLASIEERRTETTVLRRALQTEERSLERAADAIGEVTAWIVEADETPLSDLGFDALRDRHERLAAHRDRCGSLARERQALLGETTSEGAAVGLRHRGLVGRLYEEFPVDHPVLSTVVRLENTCRTCQRSVRDHLVRRV